MAIIDLEGLVDDLRNKAAYWTAADWRDLPSIPGCYAVFSHNIPIYIGKTADLRKRFALHQLDIHRLCYRDIAPELRSDRYEVVYLPLPKELHDEIERTLIFGVNPPHNIALRGRSDG